MLKARILVLMALVASLTGCSLMHDDLEPCPDGVDVALVYNYNLERNNLFGPEVKSATIYVFDEDDRFVTSHEEDDAALESNDYRMHLPLQPGKYRLVAIAGVTSYNKMLEAGGAIFRRAPLSKGDHISKLITELDRDDDGIVSQQGKPVAVHYHSIEPVSIEVVDMEKCEATISLMRHTNTLKVSVFHLDIPYATDFNDIDMTLTSAHGRVLHDNSIDAESDAYIFKPYAYDYKLTDEAKKGVASINFARAMTGDLTLVIDDALTGKTFTIDNLYDILAEGRKAPEYAIHNYSAQEYLDRQHDFELEVALDGEIIRYVTVKISILNWAKRIQNVNF